MKQNPTLVIMAAGMGSRYGGPKQIEPVGPNGEILLEYAIYDAIKAGFDKVVFVIKEAMQDALQEKIGCKLKGRVKVDFVYQRLDDLPGGISLPVERVKPWGTAHAVMSCRQMAETPFGVMNADDYYGPSSFQLLYDFLMEEDVQGRHNYCLLGFRLQNTLTEHGHVARGVCRVNKDGWLEEIHERTRIKTFGQRIQYTEDDETWTELPADTIVSMNAWGFTPGFPGRILEEFSKFLSSNADNLVKAEFYLPALINELIQSGKAGVKVLPCNERWQGMTYREDLPAVKEAIRTFIQQGVYPPNLWGIA